MFKFVNSNSTAAVTNIDQGLTQALIEAVKACARGARLTQIQFATEDMAEYRHIFCAYGFEEEAYDALLGEVYFFSKGKVKFFRYEGEGNFVLVKDEPV